MINHERDRREDARLDAKAKVCGVDVVFAKDAGRGSGANLFAVVIGDVAVVVNGGKVTEIVTRKAHARDGFKPNDLASHMRLFGG